MVGSPLYEHYKMSTLRHQSGVSNAKKHAHNSGNEPMKVNNNRKSKYKRTNHKGKTGDSHKETSHALTQSDMITEPKQKHIQHESTNPNGKKQKKQEAKFLLTSQTLGSSKRGFVWLS